MGTSVHFSDVEIDSSRAPRIIPKRFKQLQVRSSAILGNPELTDYYRSIFESCDRNQDGVVSISELKTFIETQENIDITEEVAEQIYSQFDTNKDERLDFKEFVEMVNNPKFRNVFQGLTTKICKFIVVQPNGKKALRLKRTLSGTGKYEAKFQLKKSTIRMLLVSAVQILFFFVNKANTPDGKYGPYYCTLSFMPCRKYEIYRYLTYSFVHADKNHLYGNVVIQLLLGVPMEVIHSWRVIPVYFMGVLGGAMAHAVGHPTYTLSGASAGTYAFLTIPIAAVIMNWKEMSHPVVHLLIFGTITALDVVYNVLMGVMNASSYAAHIGGAVVGLLFGVNVLKNFKVTRIEIIIWHVCWVSLIVLAIVLIAVDASRAHKCVNIEIGMGNCSYLYNY